MRIVDIQEKTVSIASQIRNAYIDFSKMTVSVVAIRTDVIRDGKPVIGYGFNSNGRYAQGCLLRERFIPRILDTEHTNLLNESGTNFDPFQIWETMMNNEKPGGHGERCVAVGIIDMALWDLVAKIAEKPLYSLIAEQYRGGKFDEKVFVYAAGGYYYPEDDIGGIHSEMQQYLDLGYRVVKMKIGGTSLQTDLKRIETVLSLVENGQCLAVDANGRFDTKTSVDYGEAMAPYRLRWFEEPIDPLDYESHTDLLKRYELPLATGENLFSMQDVRNLIRHSGLRPDRDILQMDPVLSYGLVEYLRMASVLKEYRWSLRSCIPHGGHQFALNIAAGLGLGGTESYPNVFAPFGGFSDGTPVENGYVALPRIPGIGFEEKSALINLFRSIFD